MKSLLNKHEIKESVLILPDIRSAINVGAIFRTADAVGINKIYLPNKKYNALSIP